MHDLASQVKIKAVGLSTPRGCTIAVLFHPSEAPVTITYHSRGIIAPAVSSVKLNLLYCHLQIKSGQVLRYL